MKKIILSLFGILTVLTNYAQNIGVNTTPSSPPTNTLDVNGTLRVRGGSPGVGKVLISDANGVGTWTTSSANYPRITYDAIVALPSPALGDMAYDITFRCMRIYNGSKWIPTYRTGDDNTPEMTLLNTQGDLPNAQVYSKSITTDASGNIYIAGYYRGTASFGTTSITSAGTDDIFLAKYNNNGALIWVQSAGGINTDYATSIGVDASDNVYITGTYSGTATFGSISKTNGGMFVAKYSSSGTALWVQSVGGTSGSGATPYSIKVDGAGNTCIAGSFLGTVTFGTMSKTSAGSSDIFIVKYNTSGVLLLVQSAGGPNGDEARSIATDATGNIYITGFYLSNATFGSITKASVANEDIFVAKYDLAGASWSWVQSAGGSGYEVGNSIAIDNAGYVYITGEYETSCTFGSSTINTTSNLNFGGFVAKYSTGGVLTWLKNLTPTNELYGKALSIDATGNVYVTGSFSGVADFGGITKSSTQAGNGLYDIFIAKYSSNGNASWVQATKSGDNSNPYSTSIARDASNNVYITGSMNGTVTFGNITKTVPTTILDSYIALIKE
jgi:hypothetical protein